MPTATTSGFYLLDVSTGDVLRVTRTPHVFETAPTWSPDGSRIAFARSTLTSEFDGAEEIYAVNRDGTGERLVVENRHFASSPYSLAWAPDGRSIAIETSSTIGCTSISLVAVGGGTVRPLTTCTKPSESSLAPAWQPRPTREER